jgi:ADP-heptose:LPS heptosyltransferase
LALSARLRAHIGVNFYGAGNIGDDVMMAGFLRGLGQRGERIQLTCCTPHDIASQRARFPSIDWLPDTQADRARAIGQADIWLALGDTPFQLDSSSWMRDYMWEQMDLIRSRGLPMFYLGVGVENATVLEDPIFRDLAAASARIWCRDNDSLVLLREWTTAAVAAGADLSHAYLNDPSAEPPPDCPTADLGLLLAFENPPQRDDLNNVLSKIPEGRVTWLAQEVRTFDGSEDDTFNRLSVSHRERLGRATPNYQAHSVEGLLSAWPRCKVVASSRYHGLCIMAWRGARLVAIERSGKIAAAATDLDIPLVDCLSLAEGLGTARLVPRARLIDRAASASAMIDDFCRLIGIAGSAPKPSEFGVPRPGTSLIYSKYAPSVAVQTIAVVKCDNIGDFVLLSPFMRELRRIWPQAEVVLYVRELAAELARLCPYANRVVVVSPEMENANASPSMADLAVPTGGYDLVFVPRAATDFFNGLRIVSLIGGRERRGFAVANGQDTNGSALTHAIPVPSAQSHARINLALLWEFTDATLDDRLELWPGRACIDEWRDRLGADSAKPICLLGIGAQHQSKMWNTENFAAIIPEIINTFGMLPVLVGNSDEADRAERILSSFPAGSVVNLTGFTLQDVCAVSRFAKLYVGNDTGPKHIAAAAGVPVVEINPFPPDHVSYREDSATCFHPHGVPYELLQPSTGMPLESVVTGAAVNSITTTEVTAAIARLISRTEASKYRAQSGLQQAPYATVTEAQNELPALQKRLVSLNVNRETQRRRIVELERNILEINEDRSARLKLISEQQEALDRRQAQIGELQSHLAAVNDDREARLKVIFEQQEVMDKLQAGISELQGHLAAANDDRQAQLKLIQNQRAQMETLQDEIGKLARQMDDRNALLQQLHDKAGAFDRSRWVRLGAALRLTKLRALIHK